MRKKVKYYYDSETLSYKKIKSKNWFSHVIKRIRPKTSFRLVLLNESTFEERFAFKFHIINIIFLFVAWIGLTIVFLVSILYITGLDAYFVSLPKFEIDFALPATIIVIIIISVLLMYSLKLIYNYIQSTQNLENEKKSNMILTDILKNIRNMSSDKLKKDESFDNFNDIIRYIKREVRQSVENSKEQKLNDVFLTNDIDLDRKLLLDFKYKNEIKIRFQKLANLASRRANVNLIIGISITIIAFLGIGLTLFNFNQSYSESNLSLLDYFLPRFLTLAFVQIFAFFFLKNYRSNLLEIKFYQNEITNIELKYLGLFHSVTDSNGRNDVANELIKTDRNTSNNSSSNNMIDDNRSFDLEEVVKRFMDFVRNDKKI